MKRLLRGCLLTLSVVTLTACMPLFLPPVPAELPTIEPRLRVGEAEIAWHEGEPTVMLQIREIEREGWLALQWFPPSGGEVASASVWLDATLVGTELTVPFPVGVPRERSGRWRVVVSWDGAFVRQLEWNEPAGS
jgi:hypothetical protein